MLIYANQEARDYLLVFCVFYMFFIIIHKGKSWFDIYWRCRRDSRKSVVFIAPAQSLIEKREKKTTQNKSNNTTMTLGRPAKEPAAAAFEWKYYTNSIVARHI